jgi:GDP-mannose 6-dehydrogenase
MKIRIWGCGYIGTISSIYFSKLGNHVEGIDVSQKKISLLNSGQCHFYEKGVNDLLLEGLSRGNLKFSFSSLLLTDDVNFDFICVATPNSEDGLLNLSVLKKLIEDIHNDNKSHNIVVRSTITINDIDLLDKIVSNLNKTSTISYLPEFMREGNAIQDTFIHNQLVIGCDLKLQNQFKELFSTETRTLNFVSKKVAGSIKLVNNTWHALKVSFVNEIATIYKQFGIKNDELFNLFINDTSLNLSKAYLRPGFAFGGSCLPKDTLALVTLSKNIERNCPIVSSILTSNSNHIFAICEWIHSNVKFSNGVVIKGLAFKPGTDDLRNSPTIELIYLLIAKSYHKSNFRIIILDNYINYNLIMGESKIIYDNLLNEDMIEIFNENKSYLGFDLFDLDPNSKITFNNCLGLKKYNIDNYFTSL